MAAAQDSFITSPNWPVTVNLPFPGTTETSITSKISAHFGPSQSVGETDFIATLDLTELEFRWPQDSLNHFGSDRVTFALRSRRLFLVALAFFALRSSPSL